MKFLKDNEWYYTNPKGVTKKLLLNPATNQPYKQGEEILNDNKFKGKVFSAYRYERPFSMYEKDYWGIKTRVVSQNLEKDVSGYKIPTPAVISFSGGRTSAFMLKQIINAYEGKLPEDIKVCCKHRKRNARNFRLCTRNRNYVGCRYSLVRIRNK